jgi:hypothetical protein
MKVYPEIVGQFLESVKQTLGIDKELNGNGSDRTIERIVTSQIGDK